MISNKKSEIPHVASELLHNPRSFLRAVVIIVAYLLAFVILDLISRQFEVLPGIVAWYPPTGLTYTLLLVFGVGFTPAVTIALFLSSLFIYRLPQPAYLLFLYALIVSLIYSATAAFLRRLIHIDWQLRKLRDVVWFVLTTVLVSALLAILSVSSSALNGNIPQNDIFRAIFDWWIGETVGVLTVTPFMLIFVLPTLKQFTGGQPIRFTEGWSFSRSTLSVIIQGASLAFMLYWVFGAPIPDEFRPLFLITLPLIWIAMERGLKGASAAILLLNTGVVLAVWLFRFGSARLGELELLMIITCVVGLLMGAVVTERKQAEDELIVANKKLVSQNDEKEKRAAELTRSKKFLDEAGRLARIGSWEIDLKNNELSWSDVVYQIHEVESDYQPTVESAINFYTPEAIPFISEAVNQAIKEGKSYDIDLQLITAKQNRVWVRTIGQAYRVNGEIVKIGGVFQDINERKIAEQELVVANKELIFQNEEKEKRAAELVIANKELVFQNEEKEKRAAELVIANKELVFQNEEKEKRAAELVIANKELAFQNEEKEKRAAELIVANKELVFQNEEKEKRAAELIVANKELAFQNEEKEKRATELSSIQKETDRRLQNIESLRAIDQAISGSLDLSLTLSIALEQVTTQLNLDAAAVLLLNPHTQTLEYTAVRGFRSKAIKRTRLRLGEGLAGHTALEQRLVSVHDLRTEKEEFVRSDLLAGEDFVSYHGVPLIIKGQVKGVLETFLRSHRRVDDEWLNFLVTIAGQVGIALDSASLYIDLQRSNTDLFNAFDSTIEGWSHALDLRDKETEGHTRRVTELTERFTRALGIDEAEIVHIRRGALLHDIGKMGVPDGILLKPGKLTDEEWEIIIKHPQFAYDMLVPIAYLKPALDIPYCHHEKWDGSGYPRGLKSEQIPLAARLFALVDVWDALISDRPYRKAWTKKKTVEHIKAGNGTHFDPKLVELFLSVVSEKTNKH